MSSSAERHDESQSEFNPSSSTNPATAVLDQIEAEIALRARPVDSQEADVEFAQRAPKRRRTSSNVEFVEVLLQKEGKRSAFYWQHGVEWECQRPNKKGKRETHWACSHCTSFQHYGRTHGDNIRAHLRAVHGIVEARARLSHQRSVIDLQRHAPAVSQRDGLSDADNNAVQAGKFKAALIALICCTHTAFSVVQCEFFQAVLTTLSNRIPDLLPTSHTTIQSWVIESYRERKDKIRRMLQRSHSRIHLSFDLWTSENHLAFAAVVGHFMSGRYTVESVLLAFRELKGPHTGENIAGCVSTVLNEYGISNATIGTFILDNAKNNDTCVDTLGVSFEWSKEECKQRRLRCFGHIINLVAQQFIFGAESEIFEETLQAYEADLQEGKVKLWELKGPVGKLHYIVIYIRRTPQRRQSFAAGGEDDSSGLEAETVDEVDRLGGTPATEFMTESVNCAFVKLREYYDLTDRSAWFLAGLVLNPTLKWEYLKDRWEAEPQWLRTAQSKVKKLWQEYKQPMPAMTSSASTVVGRQVAKPGEDPLHSSLSRWKHKAAWEARTGRVFDQYEKYLSEDPIDAPPPKTGRDDAEDEGVVIAYWRDNLYRFPDLARFAFDALSIPAMSTECERCFSASKRTIDARWALGADSIEACECQGQWIRRQHA